MTASTRKYTTITNEGTNHIAIRTAFNGFNVKIEVREETGIYTSNHVAFEYSKNETTATKWLKKNNFLRFA